MNQHMITIQTTKQTHIDGICNEDGSDMPVGWYWRLVRTASPPRYGYWQGPFRTKRDAEKAAALVLP